MTIVAGPDGALKAVMAILWRREQYNGVGPDYDSYRQGAPHAMDGRVELYEREARDIVDALRDALRAEIVGTPETADFMAAVPLEARHQRERWGTAHDAGKGPLEWYWLIGYLAQKAASSAVAGDKEKALHHTISTAAALANWHASILGLNTEMRPGIEPIEEAS